MKKFLIAPDKFKGSLSAKEVCAAIARGIKSVDSTAEIISIPLADGGEGTSAILTGHSNGIIVRLNVLNPLLNDIGSDYGVSLNGEFAFIEMARASGLQLIEPVDRNPLFTSTFGTGQLIRHAMEKGAKHIVLGIGGSATNDAGIGMADALGYSFLSSEGERLKPIGENLVNIAAIDRQLVHPLLSQTKFTVLCDVDNPLYGENGAAYVFGPQKGASDSDIKRLDDGLRNFEKVASDTFHKPANFPGAGAAGGLGAGASLFLDAVATTGFDFISSFTKLEDAIAASDIVITGEGKIDIQTLSGKVVKGVAKKAAKLGRQCVAFTGKLALDKHQIPALSLQKIIPLANDETSESEAIAKAAAILEKRAQNWAKTVI